MKKVILFSICVALLSHGVANEARAITCVFSADGESVTITGEGEESFSNCPSNSVNLPRGNWKARIKNVEFGEGVTEIAAMAFYGSTVENVSMPYITTIGDIAFWDAMHLKTLDMPSLQKVISRGLPENYPYISFPADAEVCINGYGCIHTSNCRITKNEKGQDYKICGTCDDYVKSGTGCVKDCGKGYLGKNGKCIDEALGCGNKFKNMGGFCNRVRYTPAEAAAVVHEDNTNVVTLTFKK